MHAVRRSDEPPGRQVFTSPATSIGVFRCPVEHPAFSRASVIRGANLIVFPRTSVIIEQAGQRPVVTDPNVVVLYNDRQEYLRRRNSPEGDFCDWFAFAPNTVADALRPHDPPVDDRVDRPFASASGHVGPGTYLAQRRLVNHVLGTPDPDTLLVEEAALRLLAETLNDTYGAAPGPPRATATRRRHAELAEAARSVLACEFRERNGVADLARRLGCSEFHLCRVFRECTGSTLSAYRNQIRLRNALEALVETEAGLTELALALGYSSHSHFTSAFRRTFAMSPSAFRSAASGAQLAAMRRRLQRRLPG